MRPLRAVAAIAATALVGAALAALTGQTGAAAAPGDVICEQFGSSTIQGGQYIVQNNRWGSSTQQCITLTTGGFQLTTSNANNPTNGAPAGYPSVYWGCHYANCTPGFNPIQLSSGSYNNISTSVGMTQPNSGEWNASYDIWLDPTPRRDGQNTGAEIMVWLNHRGAPQPVGSRVASVTLLGATWDVWFGNIGWNVVSYVRTAGTTSLNFPVRTFSDDAISRGYAQRSWYLTSIQAGFEPWIGGAGLAVNSFSVSTSGNNNPPTTTPGGNPPTTTPGNSGTASCAATFAVASSWNNGFTANITVRNTGSAATRSWAVSWTFGGGQTISSSWNASISPTSGAIRATNASYNGAIAAGQSTSFGFQASGSPTTPALTCTAT